MREAHENLLFPQFSLTMSGLVCCLLNLTFLLISIYLNISKHLGFKCYFYRTYLTMVSCSLRTFNPYRLRLLKITFDPFLRLHCHQYVIDLTRTFLDLRPHRQGK
jgi:hypothetical protein